MIAVFHLDIHWLIEQDNKNEGTSEVNGNAKTDDMTNDNAKSLYKQGYK